MQFRFNQNKKQLPCFLLFCFMGITGFSQSQTISLINDLKLIQHAKLKPTPERKTRTYIYKDAPKSFKTLNPVSLMYGGLLYVYQNSISQHFSADCLYNPSCSNFSKQAVSQFGIIKGGLLSVDRLTRCTRISATDIPASAFNPKTHRANDPISKYR